jgi:shikimate kinase
VCGFSGRGKAAIVAKQFSAHSSPVMDYSHLIAFWFGFAVACWAQRKGWQYFKDRIARIITKVRAWRQSKNV